MATLSTTGFRRAYLIKDGSGWAWCTDDSQTPPADFSTITNRCTVQTDAYMGRITFVPSASLGVGVKKYLTLRADCTESRPCNVQLLYNGTTSGYNTSGSGSRSYAVNLPFPNTGAYSLSYKDAACTTRIPNSCYQDSWTVYFKIDLTNYALTANTNHYLFLSAQAGMCLGNSEKKSTMNMSSSATMELGITYTPQYTVSVGKGTGIHSVTGGGTFDQGSSVTVSATPSTGYHFTNWTYGSSTYTPNPWTITTNITSNISVTANAAINSGTVYYYANGGTSKSGYSQDSLGKSTTTSAVNYSSTAANLYNVDTLFSRTGYHSSSDATAWRYGSATATTYFNQASQNFSSYFDSASEHGSTFNLYANWIANTYTINYNANNGSGSTAATSCTYDSNATIRSNGFTRTGYKFIGWNTAADGTGTAYSEGQSVRNLTSTNGGSITLYAQWEALATMFVKVDGSYKAGIPYVKVNGEWKRATAVYVKVNGEWKLSTR